MNPTIEYLKNKYTPFFNNETLLDELVSEVLFSYKEIKGFIENNNTNNILEVGSGTGMLLCELNRIYPHIKLTGLDPNMSGYSMYKEIINEITNNLNSNNLVIINKEIENFDTDEKFDLIFSVNVLEHVKDWQQYLINTNNLLNSGGLNIILCPNYDFPYESHYVIPIIINKYITKLIFKKKINNQDINKYTVGHWDNLTFISKRKLTKFLIKHKYNFYFDNNINNTIMNRILYDKELQKKQRIVGLLAIIARYIFLDKFLFNILKIPFPYLKLIIKN